MQQPFVPRKEHTSFMLAVFVKIGQKPIVVNVRQRMAPGQSAAPGPSSKARATAEKVTWCGARYIEIVRDHLLSHRANRFLRQRHGGVQLVHDRDPSHVCKAFAAFAAEERMHVVPLPAKAADLDPLDYGVFGAVKSEWLRRVTRERHSWQQQCQLLVELLEGFHPDGIIAALPHRIQRCIAADGWHFEG
jgi:hypothetical protein